MKSKVLKGILCAVAVLAAAGAATAYAAWWVCNDRYDGAEKVRLYIPEGAGAEQIADTLKAHLGEGYAVNVMRLWRLQKAEPRRAFGSYVVKPGTTALSLSRDLRYGRQTPVRVTFNNIRTMPQLAERVSANLAITPADFLAACDSVLPPLGYSRAQYPAAFMPDTYEFYWTAPATDVVRTLHRYAGGFWNDRRLAKAKALGLTPAQVATVASIVEEESAKTDEWQKIARLYLNRLDRGMKLQADPTVKYAVGDFSLRRIGSRHLAVSSPYNTYQVEGLPPGPIRVADRRSIDAVLDAPRHPYLYMCAKEDFSGYHNFATDFATHQANARRYQAALNKRGIR